MKYILISLFLLSFGLPGWADTVPAVRLERVPSGGIQPQVAEDASGTIHLVYFKGDPAHGDLYYTESKDGLNFSNPLKVNSVPGSAIAIGNIRGARIALGRNGIVFVIWNGSSKVGDPAKLQSPLLFSRLRPGERAFEPERNLIHSAVGLDGGSGIAADDQGRVFVFWHAPLPGGKDEQSRRVWMTRSNDDGATFAPEVVAWNEPVGACGCCSLDAYADPKGTIYVLFRSANQMVHRDMYLLASEDHGASFHGSDISKWTLGYCAMSSEAFANGRAGTYAAWETEKQVLVGKVNDDGQTVHQWPVLTDSANQKYPALAVNRKGVVLAAWTEGMKWNRGGRVEWRAFEPDGKAVGTPGSADGVPAWSLVAAYPLRNGSFVVLY